MPGACRTAGSIRARRRPVSASPGLPPPPPPPEPAPGLVSGCRCPSAAAAAASLGLGSFSSMLFTTNPKSVLQGHPSNQPSAARGAHGDPRGRPRPLPRRVVRGRARRPRPGLGSYKSPAALGARSHVPIHELGEKIPRVAPRPDTGRFKRVGSSSLQRTRALDGHEGPAGTRGTSWAARRPPRPAASGCVGLWRCRSGRPGLGLRACRQRGPRRSRPPGPAWAAAAAAAWTPPPACPGRSSRVRGASGQRARRRQHAHGGPRARAALRRPRGPLRAAAAPLLAGAPHRRAAAPPPSAAEPRGPRRMGERREARAGPGCAARAPRRLRALAAWASARAREISRPLSTT